MELSSKTLAFLEEQCEVYRDIDRHLAIRHLELEHPWKESDINNGMSKSFGITKSQEELALKLDNDKRWKNLLHTKGCIDEARKNMNEDESNIFQKKYIDVDSAFYDWETLGKTLDPELSKTSMYRKRLAILSLIAKEYGYI
ncbi:hypothetical protein LABALGNA3A7_09650 [Dellaglioa algida]|nr:hypothetical protein LABALGNA3A7_09650 [Dellaglioa algida]